jgi:signal transduction histidine kinase
MRGGLKRQVVARFIIVVLLTLLLVETVLALAVKKYYYSSIETVLTNHASVSLSFNSKYSNNLYFTTFKQNLNELVQNLSYESAELEIIDLDYSVLATSSGFASESKRKTDDVKKAIKGKTGAWVGKTKTTDEKVMAVSTPMVYNGQTLAVLRYVTSLEEVDRVLLRLLLLSMVMGMAVLFVVLLVSLTLANSIVKPIKRITAASAEMALGRFDVRVKETDRNEIGELAKTLNYMASEIARSEGVKNDFISSISHEIRTPLSSIKGWSETIQTGSMQDEYETRQGLSIIAKETDRLIGLVEELLDFSRLDKKRIHLDVRRVQIVGLLEDVILQMKSKAKKKQISILLPLNDEVQDRKWAVSGDPNRLRQVFLNLLENAIKFSHPISTIELRVEQLDQEVIIHVMDWGIGIEPQHLSRIESKFFQVNPQAEGTGLGLSICREIINLHDGKLEFQSEHGEGTTVSVTLPQHDQPPIEAVTDV